LADKKSSVARFRAVCSALFTRGNETIVAGSTQSGPNSADTAWTRQHENVKRRLQKLVQADYAVEEWIGGGSMGDVFRARHVRLHSVKAIKVLAPHLAADGVQLDRFLREAKIGANLEHPNIVGVIDYGRSGDFVYLIMNFVAGKDLDTLSSIPEQGSESGRRRWNPSEVFAIASQIAQALEVAHAHGIVHRDLKLSNICIDHTGRVVILDFGIARLRSSSSTGGTMTGEMLGTPLYMSPEQIQGEPADARSDLYSLGVIMYEMLAGSNPFDAENPQAVLYKHLSIMPPPLNSVREDIPESLASAIERLLMKDPKDRYQTATALRSDLAEMGSRVAREKKGSGGSSIGALAGLITLDNILHRNPQIKLDRELTPGEQEILNLADGKRNIEQVLDSTTTAREEALASIDSLREAGAVYIGIPGISMPVEDKKTAPRRSLRPLIIGACVIVVVAAALAGFYFWRGPAAHQIVQINASPFASVTIHAKDGAIIAQNDTPFQISLSPGVYRIEFVNGEQRKVETIEVGASSPGLVRAEFWGKEKTREVLNSYR
jgi:serine/threonine protein kinase